MEEKNKKERHQWGKPSLKQRGQLDLYNNLLSELSANQLFQITQRFKNFSISHFTHFDFSQMLKSTC